MLHKAEQDLKTFKHSGKTGPLWGVGSGSFNFKGKFAPFHSVLEVLASPRFTFSESS